jgi:hypothetical protein
MAIDTLDQLATTTLSNRSSGAWPIARYQLLDE